MRQAIIKKEKQVNELKEKLAKVSSAVLTDFRGLTVKEITELRRRLKSANIEYKIIKNNLVSRAVRESDIEAISQYLQGPTAIVLGEGDPLVSVKLLMDFAKEYKKPEIKTGVIQGKIFNSQEIALMAKLPAREVLLAQVIAGIQVPLSGLVTVLSAPIRSLLYVLKAIEQKK